MAEVEYFERLSSRHGARFISIPPFPMSSVPLPQLSSEDHGSVPSLRKFDDNTEFLGSLTGEKRIFRHSLGPLEHKLPCTLWFLDCNETFHDAFEWKTHCLSHFKGKAPPKRATCSLCTEDFKGNDAWNQMMDHVLEEHHRHGYSLEGSRPDYALGKWLWSKRIIDDATLKDLENHFRYVESENLSTIPLTAREIKTESRVEMDSAPATFTIAKSLEPDKVVKSYAGYVDQPGTRALTGLYQEKGGIRASMIGPGEKDVLSLVPYDTPLQPARPKSLDGEVYTEVQDNASETTYGDVFDIHNVFDHTRMISTSSIAHSLERHVRLTLPKINEHLLTKVVDQQMEIYYRLVTIRQNFTSLQNPDDTITRAELHPTRSNVTQWGTMGTRNGSLRSRFRFELHPENFLLGVPLPPVTKLPAGFRCPWCCKFLIRISNATDWIGHVIEDVRPYMCTYPNCAVTTPYVREVDWVRHEAEDHRSTDVWTCLYCEHVCYHKADFITHILRTHLMDIPNRRDPRKSKQQNLETSIEKYAASCHEEIREPTDKPCRFCGKQFDDRNSVNKHHAEHMEQLGLFILKLVERTVDLQNNFVDSEEEALFADKEEAASFADADERTGPDTLIREVAGENSKIFQGKLLAETFSPDFISKIHTSYLGTDHEIGTTATLSGNISSQSGSKVLQATIESQFAFILAEHPDFKTLFMEAIKKSGKMRLIDNVHRLLEQYHVDLARCAKTNIEIATTYLLRSHSSRVRITQSIWEHLKLISEDNSGGMKEQRKIFAGKGVPLDKRIYDNQALAIHKHDPVNPEELLEDMGFDDVDDDDPIEGEIQFDVLNIDAMFDFLVKGISFNTLLNGLRAFLLSPQLASLSRVLQSISLDCICFSNEDDHSFSNKLKSFAEDLTQTRWCWYPLRPRMKKLEDDQTRVHWICHCDEHLWQEIQKSDVAGFQTAIERRRSSPSPKHLCRKRMKNANFADLTTLAAASHTQTSQSATSATAHKMASAQSAQPKNTITSQLTGTATSSNSTSAANVQSAGTQVIQTNISIPSYGTWIFFVMKGKRPMLDLVQIGINPTTDDGSFFSELRTAYRLRRGFWRYWLSIWQLSHCEFVKFEKIGVNRIVPKGKDFPADTQYVYQPTQPRPPNELPPITAHEFQMALRSCDPACKPSPIHTCEPLDGTFAVESIPKRISELALHTKGREPAWGIQAQYAVSFVHVLVYHILAMVGPVVFWAMWQRRHPGDLQDASVPLSCAVMFLSLFWSSAGLLGSLEGERGVG